jgi:hypothetical protein
MPQGKQISVWKGSESESEYRRAVGAWGCANTTSESPHWDNYDMWYTPVTDKDGVTTDVRAARCKAEFCSHRIWMMDKGMSTTPLRRHNVVHKERAKAGCIETHFKPKTKEELAKEELEKMDPGERIAYAFAENCLPLSLINNKTFRFAFEASIPKHFNAKKLRHITIQLAAKKRGAKVKDVEGQVVHLALDGGTIHDRKWLATSLIHNSEATFSKIHVPPDGSGTEASKVVEAEFTAWG